MGKFTFLFLLFFSSSVFSKDSVFSYLPKLKVTSAAVHVLGFSGERVEKIGRRFMTALKRHPNWAMEVLGTLNEGEVFPWDKKLEITKAEYKLMMEAKDKPMIMKKYMKTKIHREKKRGKVTLSFNPSFSLVESITFNSNGSIYLKGFGLFPKKDTFKNENSPFGNATGYEWKLKKANKQGQILLVNTKNTNIYWLTFDLSDTNTKQSEEFSIRYFKK